MTAERSGRRTGAVSVVAFVCCALLSVGWLGLGVVAAVVHHSPDLARSLAAQAADGHDWALGLLAGAPRTEPLYQLVPDTALSVLVLALGAALLVSGVHDPTRSLLAIALAASAAAFNLQSSAASQALATVTGLDRVDLVPRFVLPVATCVAYVLAMARTPPGRPAGRPEPWAGVAAAGVALAAVLAALVYPVSVRCVLLVGLVLPLLGIVGTRRWYRAANSERLRAPARLLFGVLVGTVVVEAALAVVTGVLVWLGLPGLPVIDPTAVGVGTSFPSMPQVVLSLWAARLSLPVLAVAVLWAGRRSGAVGAQRWFSRSLVVVLVTASIGCLYVVVDTVLSSRAASVVAEGVAVALCALAFLPVFLMAERVADRLLYGTRPAPYGVLAELAALPRLTTRGVPDLAGIAEVVGRGLGATTCRLTVHRPGLRDRSYQWVRPGEEEAETFLEVPSLHGGQEVGTVAIDRAAVAGADDQRQDLLEAIANSLGIVLEAARVGIDLERQLRAALAHAAEIADARRRAVAEADSERRRLERDLHDGVQHHLVSLSMALGLAEVELGAGRLGEARARLDQVLEQLQTAETVLARTTTGLSAPPLGERGVVAALCAEFEGDPHVRVDRTGVTVQRFSPEVEAAVYFCCLEAVSNARKHAPGAPVRVRLSTERERLYLSVRDEGPGWEAPAGSGVHGRGLRNMASRIAAVGGQLQVRTAPGRGTAVEGWVPLGAPALDRPATVGAVGPGYPGR
ncbi:sensor histidine kinase [Geodermatophilus sp. URMC 61]|uniref:sensor histidine kinase n=1 Tax=Geodermatophilus sp. URMC 61 TaxID=3423411 RepID=UPI00406C19F5